ncbi:DNA polymerase III subunit epsilon [Candidatus Johnevansia muelleri]|uniref:DNA polymerase III subunit epsilon n=1 Tax=Candidatus Johnevansia muelleri TaxID=1495769 RepID=A0A078KE07_9GAMM|nr:DNA polymerase III subunit epsilon [Candidatus Evansia muelleri]
MRQIVLDTETTGLDHNQGHRIIEIGAIEIINRRITDRYYHQYINPECNIEPEAIAIHGITNKKVLNEPVFYKIADKFWEFIKCTELIIHNASFDINFIEKEFTILNKGWKIHNSCTIVDTLKLARKYHPGQRNSLDALCKRYGINKHRVLHGALIDAKILAEIYITMNCGQTVLFNDNIPCNKLNIINSIKRIKIKYGKLKVINPFNDEIIAHNEKLTKIRKNKVKCIWDTTIS